MVAPRRIHDHSSGTIAISSTGTTPGRVVGRHRLSRRTPWARPVASAARARRRPRTTASVPTPDGSPSQHRTAPSPRRRSGRGLVACWDRGAQPSVHLDRDLLEPDADPVTQGVGGGLAARPRDDRLDRALDVVPLEARGALVEVDLDHRDLGGVELVVEQVDDAVEEVGAGLVVCSSVMSLPPGPTRMQVVGRARSRTACSRSWRRPRCSRDITVPIGVSMISAISL